MEGPAHGRHDGLHLQGMSGRWVGHGLRGTLGQRDNDDALQFQSLALCTVSSRRSTYNLSLLLSSFLLWLSSSLRPSLTSSVSLHLPASPSLTSLPPSSLPSHPLRRHIHRRPRNRITRKRRIKIEQNPRVRRGIQPHQRHTRRLLRTTTLDNEIHTLRVILRPICLPCRMQSDDLVAQDVLPRRDISWDLDGPGVVISDQRVGRPVTRVAARQ